MRFTSHLDLHRAWERTLRRAGTPLTYSQGYNPRPKLNIGQALPLGFTSANDLVDVWLEERWQEARLLQSLRNAAPPGLEIQAVEELEPAAPTLQKSIQSTEYHVSVADEIDPSALQARLTTLLESETWPRERRGKKYDLRPLIESLSLKTESGEQTLIMRLKADEGATGRPDEVLEALALNPNQARVHRSKLILKDKQVA